jgi:hypothetical protein
MKVRIAVGIIVLWWLLQAALVVVKGGYVS